MSDKYICIAGKNQCAIDILKYLLKKKQNKNLLILPNKSDNGKDGWQPSLRKFAKNRKIQIITEKKLQKLKNLFLFSVEYEKILNVKKFQSKNLFNIHFSLLPKFRGCHTNYLQIKFGEKRSGVTLHKIDKGIDTGKIIDQLKFIININDTAKQNYMKLMKYSLKIFIKNFSLIIKENYKLKKQNFKKSTYFPRKYVDYQKEKFINFKKPSLKIHNKIRALIFPPFQLPIVNKKKINKSIFLNKKIFLTKS